MAGSGKDFYSKLKKFFLRDIWLMEKDSTPSFLRPLVPTIRVISVIGHDFIKKDTLSVAASLSYTAVLGMIPLLIIGVTFSKGFLRDKAEELIPRAIDSFVESVAPQLRSVPAGNDGDKLVISAKEQAVKKLTDLLIKLDAGKLGLYGIIPFIVIAYMMLRTIENSLNVIWNAKRGRPVWQQFLQYWLCLTLLPLMIFITIGLTGTQFMMLARGIPNYAAYLIVRILPFVTLWFGFTVFYKIVPNVQVKLYPAIIGGVVGGTLWQLNNSLSFLYVSKAVQMHTFFGGMAAIPIMLAALYFAWLIVLFGAHVAFAVQNIELFRSRRLASAITPSYRQKIALACILAISDCFEKGKNPPGRGELAVKTGIPETLVEEIIPYLLRSKLIRVSGNEDTYLPALPPEKIHIREVLESITGPAHQEFFIKPDSSYWRRSEKTCETFHNSHSAEANPSLMRILE